MKLSNMEICIFRRGWIIIALILSVVQASPSPLVSSSGLIPMRPLNVSQPTPAPSQLQVNATPPAEISSTTPSSTTSSTSMPIPTKKSSSILKSFPGGRMSVVHKLQKEETPKPLPQSLPPGPASTTSPPPSRRKAVEAIEHSIFSESISDKDSRPLDKDEKPSLKRGVPGGVFDEHKSVDEGEGGWEEGGSNGGGSFEFETGDHPLTIGFDENNSVEEGTDPDYSTGPMTGTHSGNGVEEGGVEGPYIEQPPPESEEIPEFPIFKAGPPWLDPQIVGMRGDNVKETEISFALASGLCSQIGEEDLKSGNKENRLYLWAPINQYIPLIHKALPVRPPVFAPECLKWVHKPCNGKARRPLLKPCSYWAPKPILSPECGFNSNTQFHMVNYRPADYIPGNCPCVWPCTRRFDPIQRCRVEIPQIEPYSMDSGVDQTLEIQSNYARQLCRGMKIVRNSHHPVPIGWLPIRIGTIEKTVRSSPKKTRSTPTSSLYRLRRFAPSHSELEKKSLGGPLDVVEPRDNPFEVIPDEPADEVAVILTFDPDRNYGVHNDFENPSSDPENGEGKDAYDGGNEDSSPITTSAKTTLTTQSCQVWKFKACSKREEGGNVRKKRDVEPNNYLDGYDDDNENEVEGTTEPQPETDLNCGQWYSEQSESCTPELQVDRHGETISGRSSFDDDEGSGQLLVKEPCPGGSPFPCFLKRRRRKRGIALSGFDEDGDLVNDKDNEEEVVVAGSWEEVPPVEGEDVDLSKDPLLQKPEGGIGVVITTPPPPKNYKEKIEIVQDMACRCDWPCLPFYDRINRCYDDRGNMIVDWKGQPLVNTRSFRKYQRDPVSCFSFEDNNEIICRIKGKKRRRGGA